VQVSVVRLELLRAAGLAPAVVNLVRVAGVAVPGGCCGGEAGGVCQAEGLGRGGEAGEA
jgi:hypothetical protein